MNINLKPARCDECGCQMEKAHRVHKGLRYCATCYSRVFKRLTCSSCGIFARLLKNDEKAVCRTCENDKPCVRCGKADYAIGKVTAYGPVCNACAHHFRKPEPCEVCGELSTRLTRLRRVNHDHRMCTKCAAADQGTCQACRRHRLLQVSTDGRMLCQVCIEKGEIPCPKCLMPMPAGYGKQCQRCYWRSLADKRIKIDCAAFDASKMASHFEAFGNWLLNRVGEQKAALTIHDYLPFFLEIENHWEDIPSYKQLLVYFGAAKLRRVLLAVQWMEFVGLVVLDEEAKIADSDRRRIAVKLNSFALGSKARDLLDGYHKVLMANLKIKLTTLRSIRLALTPATALLHMADEMARIPPNQDVLNAYLAKKPGQRAAVSGFVRYLRDSYDVEIFLPKTKPSSAQHHRRKKLEIEMMALMKEPSESRQFEQRWLSVALAYFHGLNKKVGSTIPEAFVKLHDEGLIVEWNNQSYWVPLFPSRHSQKLTRSNEV